MTSSDMNSSLDYKNLSPCAEAQELSSLRCWPATEKLYWPSLWGKYCGGVQLGALPTCRPRPLHAQHRRLWCEKPEFFPVCGHVVATEGWRQKQRFINSAVRSAKVESKLRHNTFLSDYHRRTMNSSCCQSIRPNWMSFRIPALNVLI